MRLLPIAILVAMLSGCATPSAAPRHYLDEETAATVTITAQPWIFFHRRPGRREFLSLYAIDVNRQGAHLQYIAALISMPPPLSDPSQLTLELQGGGQTLSLRPTLEDTRQLGFVKPVAPAYTLGSSWWYFPVTKDILGTVVRSKDLGATVVAGEVRVGYTKWRDGSAEIAELTAILP